MKYKAVKESRQTSTHDRLPAVGEPDFGRIGCRNSENAAVKTGDSLHRVQGHGACVDSQWLSDAMDERVDDPCDCDKFMVSTRTSDAMPMII